MIIKLFEGLGKNFVTELKLENGILGFPFPIKQRGYFSKDTLVGDCPGGLTFFVENPEGLVECGYLFMSRTYEFVLEIEDEAVGYSQLIALPQEIGRLLVHPFNRSVTSSKKTFDREVNEKIIRIEEALRINIIPQKFLKYAERLVLKMKNQLMEE